MRKWGQLMIENSFAAFNNEYLCLLLLSGFLCERKIIENRCWQKILLTKKKNLTRVKFR